MKKLILAASIALLSAVMACEPQVQDVAASASPASGALAVDGERLVIASPDHNQVLVVSRDSKEVLHRIDVSAGPEHVVIDGDKAYLSARYGNSIDIIDLNTGTLTASIEVGVEPIGLTKMSDGRLAVVLSGERAVAIIDLETNAVNQKIELEANDPRAVAQTADGRLFITHLTDGKMSAVNPDTGRIKTLDVTTQNPFGRQTNPHLMSSITVNPNGQVEVAHSQAETDTVRAPIEVGEGEGEGGDVIEPGFPGEGGEGGNCGYEGCATELPAVTPAVTTVDVGTDTVVTPATDVGNTQQEPAMDCFDCGGFGMNFTPNPPSFLNPNEARFGGIKINNPQAVAHFDGGNGRLVLNMGTRNVLMLRGTLRGDASDVLGVIDVGHGAKSIGVAPEGDVAYVWNQFDGSVTEFELPVHSQALQTESRFVESGASTTTSITHFAGETFTIVEDVLPTDVAVGRKLFHNALDNRISRSNNISCASCHPDGRSDNQTWQFTFGPRNTPQLGGGILETAPFHWPGDVSTVRDLNSMTVLAFMGGSGLDNASMDAIGQFIDTIPAALAPTALAAELNPAQLRGKEIFDSEETECLNCHSGQHYTDNVSYDVATQAHENDISLFQTPVLHGLARTAPYTHAGTSATLTDLVNDLVATDKMGKGSHLSAAQLADLAAFLETL